MSAKNNRYWIAPLVVVLVIITGFSILIYFGRQSKQDVKSKGIETVCSVYDEGKRMIKVSYSVNGREYNTGVGKGYSNIEDGEQFMIKYLEQDPESIVVFFDKPYWSDQFSYSEVNCSSITKQLSVVNYEYIVDGETITRNTIYRDHSLNPSNYLVRYRNENPKIGYLIENK